MTETPFSNPSTPTYAGPLTFYRLPAAEDPIGADVAVWGAPLDLATTGRSGARFGPRGLRIASAMISWGEPWPWNVHPLSRIKAVDAGDCLFDHGRPGDAEAKIEAFARRIVTAGTIPLTLGGDHFVTYPVLKAVAERHGPVSLIHFDAHPDTWPDDEVKRTDHGTMFYHAVREGLVDPRRSVQIGIRTHVADPMGFTQLPAPWVHDNGADKAIAEARRLAGKGKVYVTFDIDGLDPAFAPGTGTPVPGGLSTAQALAIVRGLKGLDFVGFDVVEVAPPFDHAEITALAGAQLGVEFLSLVADARG